MNITGYLNEIRSLAASGRATEHSYRPALERLFASIDDDVKVINEPKQSAVGAPDFVFERKGVSVGWCEAKDIFKDIQKFKTGDYSKEQKARYAKGLPNLIYTNGTDFEFIVKGEVTGFVQIADLIPSLPARPDQFDRLEMLLKDFASQTPISINTARQLAQMMAGKAVIIKDIMGNALVADKEAGISTELTDQYEGFKTSLIHDITIADFADVYAETIAYGLFAARLHDNSLDTFNRAEALELLPKSNPFLRNLFVYIAGPNLDDRLRRMIDDLCDVFRACDVGALMQDFGKFTARNDPFLHFYETFLAEYNPAKRKARGVWYTPEPVVNFIVRAVDDVLKTEFGLPMGLADTSKISIDWDSGQNDAKGKPVMTKKDVHRVQILDPATGTGTFLAEAIKQIAAQVKDVAPAMWSSYVERDLIPRLHGFELLMASYAMCHMKLDMMLTDMGYKPSASPPRLGVYLTNSLEEGERVEQTLPFARWLSEEAKGANTIKRDTPIMCVIGNPPYSGHSSNKGAWIEGLMDSYKVSPELKRPAQAKWLSDDYVKFMRFSEHMIEKNGEGILGFITNHSYLDNATFVDMRRSLLRTFDTIYIFDLHGNATKNEESPDGQPDKNVFDIRQGVSIIIGVRKQRQPNASGIASLKHIDFWGTRTNKYERLWSSGLSDSNLLDITPSDVPWNFKPIDSSNLKEYQAGFSVNELFSPNGTPAPGIVTTHDEFAISWTPQDAGTKIQALLDSTSEGEAKSQFRLCGTNQWNYTKAKADLAGGAWSNQVAPILYRPFDTRTTVYNSNVAVHRRDRVMRHYVNQTNIGLITGRQGHVVGTLDWNLVFISNTISDFNLFYRGGGVSCPLYLYPEEGTLETERRVNFDPKIYAEIRERAGLIPPRNGPGLDENPPRNGEGDHEVVEGAHLSGGAGTETGDPSVSPDGLPPPRAGEELGTLPEELLVFDYIYGVLHSPDYRRTYAQFLKIDFPRIPYPASPEVFAHVAEKGGQLRRLHLMEEAAIGPAPYPFMGEGDNVVVKPALSEDGRVHINPDQYFDNVPQVAWHFHIGGYQPAQKWLKDRRGRALSFEDVLHYQRIIKILCETDRIMHEIALPL